jgi:hypothetical protein
VFGRSRVWKVTSRARLEVNYCYCSDHADRAEFANSAAAKIDSDAEIGDAVCAPPT